MREREEILTGSPNRSEGHSGTAGGGELLSEEAAGGNDVPQSVLEEMFRDRDWFWPTFEPEADDL